MKSHHVICFLVLLFCSRLAMSQDSVSNKKQMPVYKNVVHYSISTALLFGIDKGVVFGYERVIRPNQSISVNFGKVSFPKLIGIDTDSFNVSKDAKNTGKNFSVDYRFYLPRENKYLPPHGLYIGPYYSYNQFKRENQWNFNNSSSSSFVKTNTEFTIHTVGFELGYQFILWKRLALDFLMVGPGIGFYDYNAKFEGNLDADKKKQLLDALQQLLTQKFPGMNYVFSDDSIDSNGTMKTTSLGYRYLIQIGFNF